MTAMPWDVANGQNPEAPWGQPQIPMQPAQQIGPQADDKRKREMLAGILMNGMSGKMPDVFQMYKWSKLGG